MKRPAKIQNILKLTAEAVDRGRLLYSRHANERLRERGIFKPEIEFILIRGHHEARKDQFNLEFENWDYAIRGKTLDGRDLRVIVAVFSPNLLIITAIDLERRHE